MSVCPLTAWTEGISCVPGPDSSSSSNCWVGMVPEPPSSSCITQQGAAGTLNTTHVQRAGMRGVITAFRLGQGGLAHQAAALAVERTARQLAAASATECCAWTADELRTSAIASNEPANTMCGVDSTAYDLLTFGQKRAQCCGSARDTDCGSARNPAGSASADVLSFANSETTWLTTFKTAWAKATSNGFASLQTPLAPTTTTTTATTTTATTTTATTTTVTTTPKTTTTKSLRRR